MSDDPNPDNLKPGPMTVAQNDAALEALLNELHNDIFQLRNRVARMNDREAMVALSALFIGFGMGLLPTAILLCRGALQW